MTFLNPHSMWLLSLIPFLILLYFLKLKRPKRVMSSTLLWQKVLEEMRVNSPFQRLKKSILLLLQIIILLLIIFAIARPINKEISKEEYSYIVLIDCSASMNTKESKGESRLDMAKRLIIERINHLTEKEEMSIVAFGIHPEIIAGFTKNKKLLIEKINQIKPLNTVTNLKQALLLAKSLSLSRHNPKIILYSDGGFEDISDIKLDTPIEYKQIGSARPNIGITALNIRRNFKDPRLIELFISIENFSDTPIDTGLSAYLNNKLLDTKYISLPPRGEVSQIFEAIVEGEGIIRLILDIDDALLTDNTAWYYLSPPITKKVLIIGDNNYFLQRILSVIPNVDFKYINISTYTQSTDKEYLLTIWNKCLPPKKIKKGNHIFINAIPESLGFTRKDIVKNPDILDWDEAHPLTRFINFSNLVIAKSIGFELPDEGMVIVRSTSTPLIGFYCGENIRACVIGFDIFQSNWPLLLSFPLFIINSLNYFENLDMNSRTNINPGENITLTNLDSAVIIKPDNSKIEIKKGRNTGLLCFSNTYSPGVYRVKSKDIEKIFTVSLMNRKESNITPRTQFNIGSKKINTIKKASIMQKEYWKYLIIVCIIFLFIEWIIYHRRIFI